MKALIVTAAILITIGLARAEQLAGKGEWRSLSGDLIGGSWTATLVRDAAGVRGSLKLSGSNVFAGGDVAGTVDASNVALGVMSDQAKQATFSAKIEGTSIKGEWAADAVNDHGVWYGTLEPAASAGAPGASQ